jgi:hypothetical protein
MWIKNALKPIHFVGFIGTTEFVPFQNLNGAEFIRATVEFAPGFPPVGPC